MKVRIVNRMKGLTFCILLYALSYGDSCREVGRTLDYISLSHHQILYINCVIM